MDFNFSVKGLLEGRKITTSIWDKNKCVRLTASERQRMKQVIDVFGRKSAQAQGVQQPVTDYNRLKSGDHTLILICKTHWVRGTRVIGGIKFGTKHLFFKRTQDFVEVESTSVLDFFVHERYQRKGFGHKLFQRFLKMTSEDPSTIAYDRPSAKMLAFLMKYYGCPQLVYSHLTQSCSSLQSSMATTRSIHRNNNFAVFESFLENARLRRVRLPGKRSSKTPNSSPFGRPNQSSSIRQNNRQSIDSTKESCTSSDLSSLTPSNSSKTGRRPRRISSNGTRQKMSDDDDHNSTRNVLKRLPGRLIDLPIKDPLVSTILTRTSRGPYPGFELRNVDTDAGPNSSRESHRSKNEPNALTRLAFKEIPFCKENGQLALSSCTPSRATSLPVDSKIFPAVKMTTVTPIDAPFPQPGLSSRRSSCPNHRRSLVTLSGVQTQLPWDEHKPRIKS